MIFPRLPLSFAFGATLALLLAAAAPALGRAETPATDKVGANATGWDLPEFIDRLPDLFPDRLPSFDRTGALRIYVRPHFGDFLHRDYVRIPVGVRAKVTENFESSTELEGYVTHGLGDASAGYGFSNLRLGAKCEHVLPEFGVGGFSVGLNYQMPLGRPPLDLTDGYRHLQPYIAATHPLMPSWPMLGYATLSADMLDRTVLKENFGRNQLHSNSLTFSAGVAHEWTRFHGSLTATVNSSALMSDETKQVYSLRPEVVLPWKSRSGSKTQVLLTLGGRVVHGPDGTELGVSGSMRVEFNLKRGVK